MSRRFSSLLPAMLAMACLPATLFAATEAQKNAAVDNALAWLAQNQQADGSWLEFSGDFRVASTGAAVLSFESQRNIFGQQIYQAGQNVVINGVNYGDVVGKGLNYLFNNAAVSPTGVHFGLNQESYLMGFAVPAIAESKNPGGTVNTGPLTGWTYQEVVQGAVNRVVNGQIPSGNPYGWAPGGWGYGSYADNASRADNSTTQWPVTALLYAPEIGVPIPQSTKDNLKPWIAYIQNPNGGSGYDSPWYLVDESKTGGLLMEMKLVGMDPSDPEVQAALSYLNTQWQTGFYDDPWGGNFGHPYAMWSIYKGLDLTLGLDADTTEIWNLHPYDPNPPHSIDNPNHGWNWYEDYADFLVNSQNADGSWNGYWAWTGPLATAWDAMIVSAVPIPSGDVPEPAAWVIWGGVISLAAGFGWWRRRRAA